jgi:uncharacterized membrane protein HdeD (DUF308 family)
VVLLFAVYAFIAAAADATRAFSGDRAGPVAGYLLLALLSVVAGVIAIAWPGITALVLTLWVAAWAAATGIVEAAFTLCYGISALILYFQNRHEVPAGQPATHAHA